MTGLIITAQIIGGLLLLFLGGDFLVRGAVGLARSFGISVLVIGLTVVAYGTSAPELVVSVSAVLSGHDAVAVGNVIGSNICNIVLVLGAAALVYPIAISSKLARRESLFLLAISALLYVVASSGSLGQANAVLFLLLLVGFTYVIFKNARKEAATTAESITEEVEELGAHMSLPKALLFLAAGLAALVGGSEILIPGAVSLARMMGLSEALIGVTLIAIGGSAPELATSIIAAFRREADIAIGNVIGSNIFNILGVLGTTALVSPIAVEPRFLMFDIPFLIGTTLLFVGVLWKVPAISRPVGVVFLGGYMAYVVAQFVWLG